MYPYALTVNKKGIPVVKLVTVTGTPTLILPSNENRKQAILQNQGSDSVFVGPNNLVATSGSSTGFLLMTGEIFVDDWSNADWWGVSAGSSQNMLAYEVS